MEWRGKNPVNGAEQKSLLLCAIIGISKQQRPVPDLIDPGKIFVVIRRIQRTDSSVTAARNMAPEAVNITGGAEHNCEEQKNPLETLLHCCNCILAMR